MQIGTPPIASTIDWNPTKSTTTKWSIVRPVSACTVLMVHPAAEAMSPPMSQPVANAELNIALR